MTIDRAARWRASPPDVQSADLRMGGPENAGRRYVALGYSPIWIDRQGQRALNARTPKLRRVVAAFAVAPLGGAAMLTVIGLALGETHASFDGTPSAYAYVMVVLAVFLVSAMVCYPVAIILGIPGYLWFRRRGWTRKRHWVLLFAMVGGGASSVGLPLLLLLAYVTQSRIHFEIEGGAIAVVVVAALIAVVGVLPGAASGLVFAWTIRVEAPSADEVAATFE